MPTITLRISAANLALLRQIAADNNMSVNGTISLALSEFYGGMGFRWQTSRKGRPKGAKNKPQPPE